VSSRRFFVCDAEALPPGNRRVETLGGRSIGVFNVGGEFFALHNRCPHRAAALCLGPVTGTTLPGFDYEYGRDGEIVRCAGHGWEFDIRTGQSLVDERIRAKTFRVEVEDGRLYVVV
jgi:nitrite reductase (NADH) small subunit